MKKKESKTYILNGVEVQEETNTQARKSNRVISVIAGLAATAVVLTGVAISTITYNGNTIPEKEIISVETTLDTRETPAISNINRVILPNGESANLPKEEIISFLGDYNMCRINDIYYSDNTDTLVSVTVTTKETIRTNPSEYTIYVAPEGYILIGDKCYKEEPEMVAADQITTADGKVAYVAPVGYVLVGTKAIKESVYQSAISPEEKTIYTAPSGYTLVDGKAEKTIKTTIEYLLTEEEYQDQLANGNLDDEAKPNYTVKTVAAKPLSDLYEILGVEKPITKNLTK